jgi:hypothetical protein
MWNPTVFFQKVQIQANLKGVSLANLEKKTIAGKSKKSLGNRVGRKRFRL